MEHRVFRSARNFGKCMVCKQDMKAGVEIAKVRIVSSRNVSGYIHANCPKVK